MNIKSEEQIMDDHLDFCDIPRNEFTPEMRKGFSRSLFFRKMVLGVRWEELKTKIKDKINSMAKSPPNHEGGAR
jgi:hypothetical protein